MKRIGSAVWTGGFADGAGTISTASGALAQSPYSVSGRFADGPGTNPEELLGAAHAACFSMAFSRVLGAANHAPVEISTQAEVVLAKVDDGYAITTVHLATQAKVPGLAEDEFQKLAETAKTFCPVSKALSVKITFAATLVA